MLEIATLSLDEPELDAVVFADGGDGGEEEKMMEEASAFNA